jgi:multidrug efflux pump
MNISANISAPFISRPIGTTLLTIGLALSGVVGYSLLPVAPLPDVDIPTIAVSASLPGASPETVATSVTTPLERHLGTIAGVTEMTSQSSVGSTRITLQFELSRDIDGAARDVEAAIQGARVDLPAALRQNPTYRKMNPADQPIIILALSSDTLSSGQIYDSASTILQQKLLQIDGIGDVTIGGSSLPAVRVELNPQALFKYGIGLEDVRAALSAANANSPKGAIEAGPRRYQVYVNDTATTAADYQSLIVAYRNNAPVRLSDVGTISDGVENVRNLGLADGKPAVLLVVHRQPGANVISVIDRIKAKLPEMQASIPNSIRIIPTNDRTTIIRASLRDVEITLTCAVLLVVLVVFVMLRDWRAALVPSVAVPLSLLGTFGAMYLLGFSLDNLSLMALTIATGFVVDDAIVVLENVKRHIEDGVPRMKAALLGAREVGFTVVSMSLSLIAVFLPILLMTGLVGRVFREFAVTLSVAILISLVVSLTTTPMMCAYILRGPGEPQDNFGASIERGFLATRNFYTRTLRGALQHPALVMLILGITVALNVYLFSIIPKGFFPQQDSGTLQGMMRADQSISFQAMEPKIRQFVSILQADPAVQDVVAFSGGGGGPGGGGTNSAQVFLGLKPLNERGGASSEDVIAGLRTKLASITGARLFLQSVQDIRAGGRQSNSQYQYTLLADNLGDLETWSPKITQALGNVPELEDVNSDRQATGLDVKLAFDRPTASRLNISPSQIDNTLYDAFGQRQVSTIYKDLNQYHVVMEVAPAFWQSPESLRDIYVSTSGGAISGTAATSVVPGSVSLKSATGSTVTAGSSGIAGGDASAAQNLAQNQIANSGRGGASSGSSISTSVERMVPLSALSQYQNSTTPLSVNHDGPFVSTTFSFNLPEGEALGTAVTAIARTMLQLHVPSTIHGQFGGTARVFQQSVSNEPILIVAAIIAVYIVLGVLYESYIHPITILSTLPSAGVGAVFALLLFKTQFSLIALIGVFLLIGIVKKNAIMMIDVALSLQRSQQLTAREAIYQACLLRFRPIMMTTLAALLGAVPLAAMHGEGAEMRQPLGIAIVGGLFFSQILTLYTTPVVYLYFDRFRGWLKSTRRSRHLASPAEGFAS